MSDEAQNLNVQSDERRMDNEHKKGLREINVQTNGRVVEDLKSW